jgi:hypothetical protein
MSFFNTMNASRGHVRDTLCSCFVLFCLCTIHIHKCEYARCFVVTRPSYVIVDSRKSCALSLVHAAYSTTRIVC